MTTSRHSSTSKPTNQHPWHHLPASEIYKLLNTTDQGLTAAEATARRDQYGPNELPQQQRDSFVKILLRAFVGPMELLLIAAAAISFLIGETVDAIAIIVIILADVLLGAVQEWKAGKTAEGLASLIRVQTKVIRDGKEQDIDASDLTLGDLVLLESGNKVSADLRIIDSTNLQIDESILTGESVASAKSPTPVPADAHLTDRKDMAYAGTSVLTGRARAIVVAIAADTEVGKIADTVARTEDAKSPLTIRMEKFTKQISIFIVIIAVLIAVILLSKGTSGSDVLLSVIALAVSAMPEGLALALTMALTIASNRMSTQNVIVKQLNAVESLGSCTVIASDKTGTLTVNEQTAKRIVLPTGENYYIEGTGYNDQGAVIPDTGADPAGADWLGQMGLLNNEAHLSSDKSGKFTYSGDSIDVAFLALGKKLHLDTKDFKILDRIPYESENKYSAVFFEHQGKLHCTAKGSLEVILSFCHDSAGGHKLSREKIEAQNEELASEGYRVIALAEGETEPSPGHDRKIHNLHFLGLVAFIDPVREEAKSAVTECRTAGIKVLMITGDHPLTAFSIAKELGIASDYKEVATGTEVDKYLEKGHREFDDFVRSKRVFTRVTPLGKLAIVESLKRRGEYVAVTGDGVNDAPALKAANIGVAMGSGTDVAKETADLIVLDDNFNSIVAGVKEGRNAYSNIRKVSYMLLSCGVAEVLFFCLAILADTPMPLVAIQLLWLNIVTNGLQDFALSFEKAEPGIMQQKPRPPKESIFNKELISEILVSGLAIGLVVFGAWLVLVRGFRVEIATARGYIMALMVFMQNMHELNCRSERQSAFHIPLSSNLWIPIAIFSAIILQIIVSEVPLFSDILETTSIPLLDMLLLFLLSTSIILVSEIYKKVTAKKYPKPHLSA